MFNLSSSFLRVASACPPVEIYRPEANAVQIAALYREAAENGASLVVFPELSVTGYSLGDLVMRRELLDNASTALLNLARETLGVNAACVVGLPLAENDALYNAAAVLANGQVLGYVRKLNLPSYNEFYENRWYTTPGSAAEIEANTLLFDIDGVTIGIEICEDAWVASPPSERLAKLGANVIVNLSASPEKLGVADFRRSLVKTLSSRLVAGYVYAGCDSSESTAEVVMGGHQLIAANGQLLAEREPFSDTRLTYADIDIDHLQFDRRRLRFHSSAAASVISTGVTRPPQPLLKNPDQNPFLPEEAESQRTARLKDILAIQTEGIYRRLAKTGLGAVIGVSGGLDSTLALLVLQRAEAKLGQAGKVHALVMPGPASSDATQSNAFSLSEKLGVVTLIRPIAPLVAAELAAQGMNPENQNVTYENIQARLRTLHLFDYANEHGLLVINTSDLSEAALGWSTYGGDQNGNYGVNCGIPKTVVRELIRYLATEPEYAHIRDILRDIIDTPISPELTKTAPGEITQLTEDKIGPYALHDFFLYYNVRWGDEPKKIAALAEAAFEGVYTAETIAKWQTVFTKRFTASQFKRDTMPNGPKIGAVALSPRGDWRMPSDV
ncbi:MAG: NAD(+) synthase [Oscillospiraceae bacterium]|jgi:NAD+ synthase (glutamine-hydrolysing)|nr:NAD(+) synthase [Oscillospiraceae bacterium]